jgi:hypothetical protein
MFPKLYSLRTQHAASLLQINVNRKALSKMRLLPCQLGHYSTTGSELFIVDNSDVDWKVVRYLHDWCQISKAIDCATGNFEIGALLALNGGWQKVSTGSGLVRIDQPDPEEIHTR